MRASWPDFPLVRAKPNMTRRTACLARARESVRLAYLTDEVVPMATSERGPQAPGPWGSAGGFDRDAPWGVSQDSPMDEGSEPTAVTGGRRGERGARPPARRPGQRDLGSLEPTQTPEAGPGGPPDPAPSRRTFPDETAAGDLPDNALEEQTGMRPEGVSKDE